MQMLAAEREFMAGQLKSASLARSRLQAHVAALQRQLREAGMQPCEAPHLPVQLPSRSRTTSRDAEGDADGFESARCVGDRAKHASKELCWIADSQLLLLDLPVPCKSSACVR